MAGLGSSYDLLIILFVIISTDCAPFERAGDPVPPCLNSQLCHEAHGGFMSSNKTNSARLDNCINEYWVPLPIILDSIMVV